MASRILIAGDRPGAGSTWALKLGLAGDLTFAVADLFEASAAARWWQTDVVLVELGEHWLAQLTGVRSFRRDHPLVPIVAVNTEQQLLDEADAQAAGIDLLLEPPMDIRQVRLSLAWVVEEVALVVHGSPRFREPRRSPGHLGRW